MGSPAPAFGFVRIIVLEVGLLSVLIAGERRGYVRTILDWPVVDIIL